MAAQSKEEAVRGLLCSLDCRERSIHPSIATSFGKSGVEVTKRPNRVQTLH